MDFPTWEKNATKPTQAVTVDGPEFDDNADGSKTAQEVFIEQQWRDVESSKLGERHPLSINRDASQVTADPYTS
jgi:hypothetical protein